MAPDAVDAGEADEKPGASTAQMVFMAPIEAATLGPRGYEVVTMNLDGTNRRELTDNDRQEFLPHFSPDATRVAYTMFDSGSYGEPGASSDVAVFDLATGIETNLTNTGEAAYPVWSPDGSSIAFLSMRGTPEKPGPRLWLMRADGSDAHEVGGPSGAQDDQVWGDIAWSSDDWILFVVAERIDGCFKTRLDKIRPDGKERTKVTDGGPSCTPEGMEQSGDADPGFGFDGKTIYSSRGLPSHPAGSDATTERKLYAVSSAPWAAGKPETDLSLASQPSCIEGVPKGSPDGQRILLFRKCFDVPDAPGGVYVTDASGSYRTWIVDGFGPDWNPLAPPD